MFSKIKFIVKFITAIGGSCCNINEETYLCLKGGRYLETNNAGILGTYCSDGTIAPNIKNLPPVAPPRVITDATPKYEDPPKAINGAVEYRTWPILLSMFAFTF